MWTIALGMTNEAARRLQTVKLLHTVLWAVFAGCVVALPWRPGGGSAPRRTGSDRLGESVLWYRSQVPGTAIAARYTDDRRANFGIYLQVAGQHNSGSSGRCMRSVAHLVVTYLGVGKG
jgi:hypothetical protein